MGRAGRGTDLGARLVPLPSIAAPTRRALLVPATSEPSTGPASGSVGLGPCPVGAVTTQVVYVDARGGSDAAAGTSAGSAWRTLWPVRALLASPTDTAVQVYLARGSTWSVASELAAFGGLDERRLDLAETDLDAFRALDSTDWSALAGFYDWLQWTKVDHPDIPDLRSVFLDVAVSGRRSSQVLLTAHGDPRDPLPVLDGLHGVWTDSTRGIRVWDRCHVQIEDIELRGFFRGVEIRGDSSFVTVTGCKVHRCFDEGILISRLADDVPSSDNPYADCPDPSTPLDDETGLEDLDDESWNLVVQGCTVAGLRRPRLVTIEDCEVFDNGVLTSSANIALSGCAGRCTITGNLVYSTGGWRGVDGLTLDSAGTGHTISCNWFAHHVPSDGSDGDGIDLKGVRPDTPDSTEATLIHDNVFLGNRGKGLEIHNGCKHIHAFNNVFLRNGTGIHIGSGTISRLGEDWWEHTADMPWAAGVGLDSSDPDHACDPLYGQGHIYLYRNLVSQSLNAGIEVDADAFLRWHPQDGKAKDDAGDDRIFASLYHDIALVQNTVDFNGGPGLSVNVNRTQAEEVPIRVRDLTVLSNIFSRNGLEAQEDDPGSTNAYVQVVVNGVADGFGSFEFPYGSGPGGTDPDPLWGTAPYVPDDDDFATWTVDRNWYWTLQPHSVGQQLDTPEEFGAEAVWASNVYQYWDNKTSAVLRTPERLTLAELQSESPAEVSASGARFGLAAERHWIESGLRNPDDADYVDGLIHDPDLHLSDDSPCIGQGTVSTGVTHALTGLDVGVSPDADHYWPAFYLSSSGVDVAAPDLGAWQQALNRGSEDELACSRPPLEGRAPTRLIEALFDRLAGADGVDGMGVGELIDEMRDLLEEGNIP